MTDETGMLRFVKPDDRGRMECLARLLAHATTTGPARPLRPSASGSAGQG